MKQILLFRIIGNIRKTVRRICILMLGCKGLMDGRRGGLTVSALNYGSRGLGSRPGQVIALRSWAEYFTLTRPLSTQEHKWELVNCQRNLIKCCGGEGRKGRGRGDKMLWTCIPSMGEKQHPRSLWPNKSLGCVMPSLSLTLTHQWAFWLGVVKRKSKRARILR